MDTSEKQIIGENAKYVSDTIPQETKDGLRAHLKPGYAMPDGTHYATGMDYTELMRNLRNIQYCGCPLCHDTQSGLKTILATSGMTVRELAEEIACDEYDSYSVDEIRDLDPEQLKPVDEIVEDINRWSHDQRALEHASFGTVRLLSVYLNVSLDQMYDELDYQTLIYTPWEEDSHIYGYVTVIRYKDGKYEVDVPECRYQCDEMYWNARRKMEESNTPITLDVLRSEPWSKEHRTPVALPEQYRGKQYHLGGHSSLSALLDKLASHDVPVDERVLIALELEEQFPLRLTPLSDKD